MSRPDPTEPELARLMVAFQAGSEDAWSELERHLFPLLAALFRAWQAGPDVEDLAQESLIRIRWAGNFDPGQNPRCDHPFRAWYSTIAHRLWIDSRERTMRRSDRERWAGQRQPVPPLSPEEVVVADEERREVTELVRDALADLGWLHREVLGLEMEGLGNGEIAQVLHVNVGTVRSRLSRARAQLVEALERRGCVAVANDVPLPDGGTVVATFCLSRIVRLAPDPAR